jgi:WD40 repeat protein
MRILIILGLLGLSGCNSLPIQQPAETIESAEELGVTGLEFDASGKRFATTSIRGEISIWSYPENKRQVKFWTDDGRVQGLAWASDQYLLAGGTDRRITLYDVSSQKIFKQIQLQSSIQSVAYVPSKNWVVSGHLDGTVRVHTVPDLEFVGSYETDETVVAVTASLTGMIASSGDGGQTLIFQNSLKTPREIQKSPRAVNGLRFSPDSKKLLGSGWSITLWDVETGQVSKRSTGHIGLFGSLDVSPDSEYVATIGCMTDTNVYLYSLATGKLKREMLQHEGCGHAVRFSHDGKYLVTASEDESIRFYDLHESYPTK